MAIRKMITTISVIFLTIIALVTLFLSSSILFDWFDMPSKQGNYVLFIVWTNFIASFLYLISVYGFIKKAKWTFWPLTIALTILIIAFIALQIHINNGGIHEQKTVAAMIFRISVTLIIALVAFFNLNKPIKKHE